MKSDPLAAIMAAGKFEPFIRHIRFPRFKNLEPGLRLNFTYPITALVGPNGTNKSSILRALQACPVGSNIGDYWFDTELDRIDQSQGPHRYVHGFRVGRERDVEVIKTRIGNKARGDDYFETARLRPRDGGQVEMPPMEEAEKPFRSKTRWKPIEKAVVYLDFRQELPAFDIYMHFGVDGKDPAGKKDRVRRVSKHVAAALDGEVAEHNWHRRERIDEAVRELGDSEVRAVSAILGREYRGVQLLRHSYFAGPGFTARLRTDGLTYSEAFAGSGEFAAVMIVDRVSSAAPGSLILLDEPETSLHPKAQLELLAFLRDACKKHKHQIVMASHSAAMIAGLPREAIKMLDVAPATGRVVAVSSETSPAEAFERLGHITATEKNVIVEDELAAAFVRVAALSISESFQRSFSVRVLPGGAEQLLKVFAPQQAATHAKNTVLVLDGDQRWNSEIPDNADIADADIGPLLADLGISEKDLPQNSGGPTKESQVLAMSRTVAAWLKDNVRFLPGQECPEATLLRLLGQAAPENAIAAKQWWVDKARAGLGLSEDEPVTAEQILTIQRLKLNGLSDDPEIQSLGRELLELLDR